MLKRVFVGILALALCLCIAVPAFAVESPSRLVDQADLLTAEEEAKLLEMLDEISQRQRLDVVIVTADNMGGKTTEAYADDFFDYGGYAADGVLMLVNMEDRKVWISTTGYGITAFTDAGIDYILDQIEGELSGENYARAMEIFAENCDDFINQARSGDPYDTHNLPEEPFDPVFTAIVALVIGLIVALIATGIMRSKLKSVRNKYEAADYVRPGSMQVTVAREIFLYRQVHRVPRPKDGGSSTHRSSSGQTHGGGGRSF